MPCVRLGSRGSRTRDLGGDASDGRSQAPRDPAGLMPAGQCGYAGCVRAGQAEAEGDTAILRLPRIALGRPSGARTR